MDLNRAMENKKTIILAANDVNAIVNSFGLDALMDTLIERTEKAILNYSQEKINIPIRSGFNYDECENPGLIEMMPVHIKNKEVSIKVVGYHPKNPTLYNLPTILSTISSYSTNTGHLKGIADGVLLTALRTGAASAIASKLLAKPSSSVLGLIGCGAQAVTQLHAISRIFEIKKIMLFDIDRNAMKSLVNRISMLNLDIEIVFSSIQEIIETVDIVCTETSIDVGEGPLFKEAKALPHLHINAIGADFPGKFEIPVSFLETSLVCPDFIAQAKIEGECQQLKDEFIGPDLVALLHNKEEYAHAQNQHTVFDSTGWALEDQVIMDLFLELANKYDVGEKIALENISEDSKNPYNFMLQTQEV